VRRLNRTTYARDGDVAQRTSRVFKPTTSSRQADYGLARSLAADAMLIPWKNKVDGGGDLD
jgi:hypothetical protein